MCLLQGIQHSISFVAWRLGVSSLLYLQIELRNDQPMVSPTLSPTHGSGDTYITPVSLSNYCIVDDMPVLAAWIHPRGFLVVWQSEYSVSDQKVV